MSKGNSVIIIGAGIGGITAAIYLARQGYRVKIFEKNTAPGGRCGILIKDGHRFDIGPTFIMMPNVFEDIYTSLGRNIYDELNLLQIEPLYKIKFRRGEEILFTSNLVKLRKQLDAIEPGSNKRFLKLIHKGYNAYKLSLKYLIDHNFYSVFDI